MKNVFGIFMAIGFFLIPIGLINWLYEKDGWKIAVIGVILYLFNAYFYRNLNE